MSILFLSVLLRSVYFQSVTNMKGLRPDVQLISASVFHKSSGDGHSGRAEPLEGTEEQGNASVDHWLTGLLTTLHTVSPNTCSATQKHIIPAHIRTCVYAETHHQHTYMHVYI